MKMPTVKEFTPDGAEVIRAAVEVPQPNWQCTCGEPLHLHLERWPNVKHKCLGKLCTCPCLGYVQKYPHPEAKGTA
jgi:hypothetical protein